MTIEEKIVKIMDKRQKLQEILKKCIDKWLKPYNVWFDIAIVELVKYVNISTDIVVFSTELWDLKLIISIHDLFSKDSWLMEFVEWRDKNQFYIISSIATDKDIWQHDPKYHYMLMWPMTAEEKIEYFLDNIIIEWN